MLSTYTNGSINKTMSLVNVMIVTKCLSLVDVSSRGEHS